VRTTAGPAPEHWGTPIAPRMDVREPLRVKAHEERRTAQAALSEEKPTGLTVPAWARSQADQQGPPRAESEGS
jgi:hypothetical protein